MGTKGLIWFVALALAAPAWGQEHTGTAGQAATPQEAFARADEAALHAWQRQMVVMPPRATAWAHAQTWAAKAAAADAARALLPHDGSQVRVDRTLLSVRLWADQQEGGAWRLMSSFERRQAVIVDAGEGWAQPHLLAIVDRRWPDAEERAVLSLDPSGDDALAPPMVFRPADGETLFRGAAFSVVRYDLPPGTSGRLIARMRDPAHALSLWYEAAYDYRTEFPAPRGPVEIDVSISSVHAAPGRTPRVAYAWIPAATAASSPPEWILRPCVEAPRASGWRCRFAVVENGVGAIAVAIEPPYPESPTLWPRPIASASR